MRYFIANPVPFGNESDIHNGFIRFLAGKSQYTGHDIELAIRQEAGFSVHDRYAPMRRLLNEDDEIFLDRRGARNVAMRLRRAHRRCYFGYIALLTREVRQVRRLQTAAMASQKHWNFRLLVTQTVISEASLIYLRWLGFKHAAGVTTGARDVAECLNFVLAGPKFGMATT